MKRDYQYSHKNFLTPRSNCYIFISTSVPQAQDLFELSRSVQFTFDVAKSRMKFSSLIEK